MFYQSQNHTKKSQKVMTKLTLISKFDLKIQTL